MLPSAQTILEAAQRRDWYTVLGIAPGARLSPKQERAFRVEVHPDKGHCHHIAAVVGQALDALRGVWSPPPVDDEVDCLIQECSRAVQSEPLNAAGVAAIRRLLDALVVARTVDSLPRIRYYYKGWGEQASERCYQEIWRIWQLFEKRMGTEPVRAPEIGREFLAQAAEIEAFCEQNFPEAPGNMWCAHAWVKHEERIAYHSPAAKRQRKTLAQRTRRADRRAQTASVSEADALASVLQHCEVVDAPRATPLGELRAGLRARGPDRKTLLAAGITSQTRRQHRPVEGAPFYYGTVSSRGRRVPLRLREE